MLGRVSFNPAVHIDPIGTLLFPLVALLSNIPVIGWAKPVPVNLRNLPRARRDFLVVAAAGPASNLLLAVLGAVAWRAVAPGFIAGGGEPGLIVTLVWLLVNINILLAVFNMLPIPPLDGGNVLAGILPEALAQQFDRLRRASSRACARRKAPPGPPGGRAPELGRAAGAVRLLLLRRRLARADERLRRHVRGRPTRSTTWPTGSPPASTPSEHALRAVARARARRAVPAAVDDRADPVARARADLQGADRAALRAKDLSTLGFLGYPLLQTADVIIYNARFVPVGEDQVPHLELSREVVRRFHNFYGELFVEPQPLLTPVPRLPGLDNRKMSKSYSNTIDLSDDAETVKKKVWQMYTDPKRVRADIPGTVEGTRCSSTMTPSTRTSRGRRPERPATARAGRRRRGEDASWPTRSTTCSSRCASAGRRCSAGPGTCGRSSSRDPQRPAGTRPRPWRACARR
jgi:hypothetical protein